MLSSLPGFDTVPSPDGRHIAYLVVEKTGEDTGRTHLEVANAAGSGAIALTSHADYTGYCCNEFYPSWSPDSRRVTEVEKIGGTLSVRVYPVDGSRGWTTARGTSYYSAWQP